MYKSVIKRIMNVGCQRPVSLDLLLIATVGYQHPANDYQPQHYQDVSVVAFAACH